LRIAAVFGALGAADPGGRERDTAARIAPLRAVYACASLAYGRAARPVIVFVRAFAQAQGAL
jgi:hypothetical protein